MAENYIETIKSIYIRQGLTPPPESKIVPDGKIRRWDEEGKRNGKGNIWLAVYSTTPLYFRGGDWSIPNSGFKYYGEGVDTSPLTDEEQKAIWEQRKRQREEEEEQRKVTLSATREEWKTLPRYSDKNFSTPHPYLTKKGLKTAHLARWKKEGNLLVFPLLNEFGEVENLQKIDIDGQKRFVKGLRKRGLFCPLWNQNSNTEKIFAVEGFATGLSVLEATNTLTVVCIDCGNLTEAIRSATDYFLTSWKLKERPESFYKRFTIIADNDTSKAGEEGARKAVTELKCNAVLIPEEGMDANDYAQAYGVEKLAKILGFNNKENKI